LKLRERDIESKVVDHAKNTGWLTYKFKGQKSVPDRVFIKNGNILYIEFKAPGEKPTALQQRTINMMLKFGASVSVVDDIDKGKRLLDDFV